MKRYLISLILFGLSPFSSANTQDYQPQNKVEFKTLAEQAHAYNNLLRYLTVRPIKNSIWNYFGQVLRSIFFDKVK